MSKLSLNLTKISKNQPKLVIERFFFVGKENGLVRRAGEEKRINSNNIHLRKSNSDEKNMEHKSQKLVLAIACRNN